MILKLPVIKRLFSNQLVQAVVFVIALWILYQVRVVLFAFLFAFIIMSGLKPFVEYLQRRNVPKGLAILLPYAAIFIVIGFTGYLLVPAMTNQAIALSSHWPEYVGKIEEALKIPSGSLSSVLTGLTGSFSQNFFSLPLTVLYSVISIFSVIIMSIYMLWYPDYMESFAKSIGSESGTSGEVLRRIERGMGSWVRGQIVLSLIVGFLVSIGLIALGIDFPLVLGLVAAFMEIIQFFGPVISAGIAMLVAANKSLLAVGLVAILFFIIQQLESHILVPQVMRKSVDLHPITVILAILIGDAIFGLIGAIAAVPISVIFMVFWNYKSGNAVPRNVRETSGPS